MEMKKVFICILMSMFASYVFAQWSDSGLSKTTGDLQVGEQTRSSELRINGESEAKLSFWFAEAGIAAIRGTRKSNGGFEFLTLNGMTNNLDTQMSILPNRVSIYPDVVTFGDLVIGDANASPETELGAGKKLSFMGIGWNYSLLQMYRYNRSFRHSDLRVDLGTSDGGNDRFVIGNTKNGTSTWNSWLAVLNNGNVGIGIENPQNKLDVAGTIRAQEVKIENANWPDYVFSKDYRLPSLSEVSKHIEENQHLPGIPSAKEVEENGISLSEMNAKLLQKIEELTLYVIQQEKAMGRMQKEIDELKNK